MRTILLILSLSLGTLTSTASDLVEKARLVDAMMNDTTAMEHLSALERGTLMGGSIKMMTSVQGMVSKRNELAEKAHRELRRIVEQSAISQFTLTELKMIDAMRSKDEQGKEFALKVLWMGTANDSAAFTAMSNVITQLAKEMQDAVRKSNKPGRERILHDRKP